MERGWREQSDWIHRSEAGELLPILDAFRDCSSKNIRPKTSCSAETVKSFFEKDVFERLSHLETIQPNANLLQESLKVLYRKSFVSLTQHNEAIFSQEKIQRAHDVMQDKVRSPHSYFS